MISLFFEKLFSELFSEAKKRENPRGGGVCSSRISERQKEKIGEHVKSLRNTAMSKGDIVRAVKTVYGYDQEAVEELVNEVW